MSSMKTVFIVYSAYVEYNGEWPYLAIPDTAFVISGPFRIK